ncbi:MAG: hypothetical protein GX796_04955 [Clostridiaceae bacterium]|nr:hypothetical protein [Clostridiaceae bacterium]
MERVIQSNYASHFFGSLVSVITPSPKKTEYILFDWLCEMSLKLKDIGRKYSNINLE